MADTTRTTPGSPPGGTSAPLQSGNRPGDMHQADHGAGGAIAETMNDAKKVGSELVGAVRDSAVSLLDTQRGRAADQISAIGEAMRKSAQSLDGTSGEIVVPLIDKAAEQITGFAGMLRDRSWSDLAGDVESFARRWPMAFMASAVGIGFIAGRFMLSSAERAREEARASWPAQPGIGTQPQAGAMRHDTGTAAVAYPSAARPGYGTTATGE